MFYSHQLLNKKHPMGQIWIAATIRAGINRKKAAKINIEQICKQILNPPVPLALRLSGILMGGIVHIYDRKVHFLIEDLNSFLMKIRVDATRKDVDRTTLTKRKYRAKYENITMASEGFQISQNIERPMRHPHASFQGGESTLEEMFFVFPGADNGENFEDNSSPRDHFQAALEDITLQDNAPFSPFSAGGCRKSGSSGSPDGILGHMDDCLPEIQLPDQRPTPQVGPEEDCFPDPVAPENIQPDFPGTLHTIFEDQLPDPENNQNNTEAQLKQQMRSAERSLRKRKARAMMFDEDTTEIPRRTFAALLEDTSDIVGGSRVRQVEKIKNKQLMAAVKQNWALPSVCVSLNVKLRPEPTWAPPLQEMWRKATSNPSQTDSGKKRARFVGTYTSPPSSGSKQSSPIETDYPPVTDFPTGGDFPPQMNVAVAGDFSNGMEFPTEAELRIDPEDILQSPAQSLGSVEKLRAALQTPNTGSQEDIFGKKLGLRTPALFAPLNTGGSSKRSMSVSHGGSQLSYDSEGEPPTSEKSKRSRPSSVKGVGRSMSPMSGELPDLNFLPRRASSKSDMIEYFASGDFQAGILAQSQLLEDTGGSTQKGLPADSINTTTIVLAKLLRDHFNKLKTADISEASIFNLTSRLDTTQAARMFYQICVLASNESITVKQSEPYGDILLKRGVTL